MIKFVPHTLTGPTWRTVELGDGDTIEIAIRRPTLGEQLAYLEDARGDSIQAFNLRSRIIDWRGVQDADGKPVPYSWDTLGQLCMGYENAIWELLSVVREAVSRGCSDLKNFESPPLAGGTEVTVSTTDLTTSSVSITNSADNVISGASLD